MAEFLRIIFDLVVIILIITWIIADKKSAILLHNMKDLLYTIFSQLNHVQMDQQTLAAELAALTEKTEKAHTEIVGKIADLETAIINAGDVSPDVLEKFEILKASVYRIDDIVADAEGSPASPAEEETTE
jgi:uncharacterized protein YoxC